MKVIVDINKLVNVRSGLNDSKAKVDDLHVDKLETVPVNLKKLSNGERKDFDQKTEH